MTLTANRYGKSRVRIMRVVRGATNGVSELSVQCMLEGDFAAAYSGPSNKSVVATDSIKNIINITARQHLDATPEAYCIHLAEFFLTHYPQVARVIVTTNETRWTRLNIAGHPHPHSFVLDPNGTPTVRLEKTRQTQTLHSGIEGFTFMKSTGAGWVDYVMDEFTTLPETQDRIVATSMKAEWLWTAPPADPAGTADAIITAMLTEFATTYSHGVQDSLYRMGQAALTAAPDITEITIACPNKHYLPINLAPFGLSADNMVFTPTDEPHGQIECTIRR